MPCVHKCIFWETMGILEYVGTLRYFAYDGIHQDTLCMLEDVRMRYYDGYNGIRRVKQRATPVLDF